MIHHRSADFGEILSSARNRLNALIENDGESVLFTSSGTGGMEAAIASLFSSVPSFDLVLHGTMLEHPCCMLAMVFFTLPFHRRGARELGPLSVK